MADMSRGKRARRYLQASMKAGLTGLPQEHREAYEAQMREHERAYRGVREHALAGADQDFDKPLTPGEREHQAHLREKEGLEHAQVLAIRKQLRGKDRAGSRPARPPRRAGLRTPQAAATGTSSAIAAATTGKGSLFLQIAGLTLGLSLAYLLLAGKNIPKALEGLAGVVTGAAKAFVAPTDPILAFERAIGATSSMPAGGASPAAAATTETAAPSMPLPPAPSKVKYRVASPAASNAFAQALKHAQVVHAGGH